MKKWVYLLALLILLQALSAAIYLGKTGQPGFPLDDAWIHQTYARNLGLHGVMAFSPGQPSTGSTSFGWTLLLAVGYLLRIPFFLWTYFLGSVFAIATAFSAARLSENYFGNFRKAAIVAVLCILEWHLAWAAVSGMEIGLFTFVTLLFFLCLDHDRSPFLVGSLIGVIILVRPEGMILALIYLFKLILNRPGEMKRILIEITEFVLALSIVITPWIAFNLIYSHRPFPNTISAKFMQYGFPWTLWKSLKYPWDVLIYFLNGPLMLLVPGAVFAAIFTVVKTKARHHLYPCAWIIALIGTYSVALPSIYDHGRYLMPLTPLVTVYGVQGLAHLLERFLPSCILRRVAWLSLFGMFLLLWINGASDFAYRIQLFNRVHMKAAQWINTNTTQDTVIATHDIGIIGYYTERPIVDLAGLITPEIVPMLKDQHKMADYIDTRQVTYLIVYSGYYRELLMDLHANLVFSPSGEQLKAMGIEPFEVYEICR